jgi:hypothetical protein
MAQAVSRRSLTAEDQIRSRSVRARFVVDKVALRQVFSRVLPFSSVVIPSMLYTHLHQHIAFSRTKERMRKAVFFWQLGGAD